MMIKYQRGKKIKTWEHLIQWVIKERRRVFLHTKGGGWQCHSFNAVAKMSLKTIKRIMNKGFLFEAHNKKGYSIIELLMCIIVIIIAFIFVVFMFYKQYNLGKQSSDYKIVCIYGHEYYRASFITKGFLAIKLDKNGNPVSCR